MLGKMIKNVACGDVFFIFFRPWLWFLAISESFSNYHLISYLQKPFVFVLLFCKAFRNHHAEMTSSFRWFDTDISVRWPRHLAEMHCQYAIVSHKSSVLSRLEYTFFWIWSMFHTYSSLEHPCFTTVFCHYKLSANDWGFQRGTRHRSYFHW